MNFKTRTAMAAVLWSVGAGGAVFANPILTLTPFPDLAGAPGSVVGWGFTLTNDSGYIEINSAQFCLNPIDFPNTCVPPALGTFVDFISGFNDIIVGDSTSPDMGTESQPFDALAHTGIGSLAISTTAAGTDVGQVILTYTLTDVDPSDPGAIVLGSDLAVSAEASVSTAPEPGVGGLILLALAVLTCAGRYRGRLLRETAGDKK